MSRVKTPPKPYPTFPLFAHRNGSWKKKVEGRQYSFGPWRWPNEDEYVASWKHALAAYNQWAEENARGVEHVQRPETVTIGQLVDHYLTAQENRVGREIEARTFAERRQILREYRDAMGATRTIVWLEDRAELLLEYLRQLDRRYGFHRYNAHVKEIAGAYIAAEHPLTGILQRPFRLRPLLKKKKDLIRRREKSAKTAIDGKQMFSPAELRALFDNAELPLRAMMGLAYYAAFGNDDCAKLPQNAFNFSPSKSIGVPAGWAVLDWTRPKTEVNRAAMIPDDLVKDLKQAIASRPKPLDPKRSGHLVFLTKPHPINPSFRGGLPYVRDIIHYDDADSIEKTVRVDGVQKEFEKLRDRLSFCPQHGWICRPIERLGVGFRSDLARAHAAVEAGRKAARPNQRKRKYLRWDTCPTCESACSPMRRLGFYAFRHTATTYAIPAASQEARVLVEGHRINGVRDHYVEELDAAELVKIARKLIEKREQRTDEETERATRNAVPPSAA